MRFDSAVYSKDALLAAAYWCADKCTVDITAVGSAYEVELRPRGNFAISADFEEQFQAMVVHNEIRGKLRQVFAPLETAIVQKAFSPISH